MLQKVKFEIEPEKERKILNKLYSIALTKMAIGELAMVKIDDFKHIIGTYQIKQKNWFRIAKSLESRKFVKVNCRSGFLTIRLNYESLVGLYRNNLSIQVVRVRKRP